MHDRLELLLYAIRQPSRIRYWTFNTGIHSECLAILRNLGTSHYFHNLCVVSLGQFRKGVSNIPPQQPQRTGPEAASSNKHVPHETASQ